MINWELYEQIASDGLLISEYYPGEKALPYHFPTRNRIISGLSDALLVIEARQKSGALITAGLALDQGKDVYAIPQNITMEKGFGSNELLKSGALLATEPEDVLFGVCADLRVRSGLQVTSRDTAGIKQKHKSGNSFDPAKEKCLTDLNRRILGKIQDGADTPDKLIEAAGISIMAMNQALSELELDGFIRIEFGRIFAL
jgi:DNA processing protein